MMKKFKELLLQTKKVSIWGIGYLGYTTIYRLQENGFNTSLYDFNESRLDELLDNKYPDKEQKNSWSKSGELPFIDISKVEVVKDIMGLFDNQVHIISFPNTDNFDYRLLATQFIKNKNKLKDCLVIFQSAGIPKSIENDFLGLLKKENIEISTATVFRSDWTIENFLRMNTQRIVSANSKEAMLKTEVFLEQLCINIAQVSTIEEAEIFENVKTSLSYTVVAFFNQLSLAYPDVDINKLSKLVLKNIDFTNIDLGVNSVDFKSEQSIESLLKSSKGDFLTLLQEANSTNLSFLFYYINLLKSKNIDSVTILGLSSSGSMKDIRFSPSVILAEYLDKENIEVYIHDEYYSKDEILETLPFSKYLDIHTCEITTSTVIVMNMCKEYKFFTQDTVEKMKLTEVEVILDNTGFFKNFKYSVDTLYHQLCDGNLIEVTN